MVCTTQESTMVLFQEDYFLLKSTDSQPWLHCRHFWRRFQHPETQDPSQTKSEPPLSKPECLYILEAPQVILVMRTTKEN